jgi:hypothetical protein
MNPFAPPFLAGRVASIACVWLSRLLRWLTASHQRPSVLWCNLLLLCLDPFNACTVGVAALLYWNRPLDVRVPHVFCAAVHLTACDSGLNATAREPVNSLQLWVSAGSSHSGSLVSRIRLSHGGQWHFKNYPTVRCTDCREKQSSLCSQIKA